MVESASGYVIVDQKQASRIDRDYRGLYRMHPFSEGAYKAGFDDPLIFGNFTNSRGLIRTLAGAIEVMKRYRSIDSATQMEIVWTRECDYPAQLPPGCTFLGIDVACSAPFWSILVEVPREPFVEEAAKRKNRSGLFDRKADAQRYLSDFRAAHPAKAAVDLYLWEVYSVESTSADR